MPGRLSRHPIDGGVVRTVDPAFTNGFPSSDHRTVTVGLLVPGAGR